MVIKGLVLKGQGVIGMLTRFRYFIPKRRVKLILGLHDLREEPCLCFFIKWRISTEPAQTERLEPVSEDKRACPLKPQGGALSLPLQHFRTIHVWHSDKDKLWPLVIQ